MESLEGVLVESLEIGRYETRVEIPPVAREAYVVFK